MNHEVFICYASEDKPTADAVCAILEENRVRCWIAPRDVLPAEDYGEAIVHSISASRLVVFVFSAHANASPHVKRELEGAVSHGIPILPFRIEDTVPSDSLQYYLGGIHWLDALTPPLEAHLQHLAGTVRVLLDRNEQALSGNRAPSVPPPGPSEPPVKPTGPEAGRGGLRRAWLIGLGVLVVVGIGVGIAVAFGGGGGGGGGSGGARASRTTTSATTAQDVASAEKACALVNPADIRAAFGSAGPGVPNPSGGAPDCTFTAGATNLSVFIRQEGATQADFNSSRQAAEPGTQDVPGIGGGAYVTSSSTGDSLIVFDPKRALMFNLFGDPNTKEQLISLARLTLARG